MPARGDVCLVEYPFTDKAASKLRPALVLQGFGPLLLALTNGSASPTGQNAVFVPITSRIEPGEFNVVITEDDAAFHSTGLKVSSTIVCWNINTIHKGFIKRTIGKLQKNAMVQVEDKLRRVLGL